MSSAPAAELDAKSGGSLLPAVRRPRRLLERALEPIDAASMVAWRVAFGALMFVGVVRFFAYGWIAQLYIEPSMWFPYHGFEWLSPWPDWGMYVHFAALGCLAVCIAAGVWWRASTALFFLGFTYVELLDQTNYLNHYYLVSILALLLVFMPLGRGVAVAPRWCLWVLRAQVGLVYVFAGVAKLNADWLLQAQPLRIWFAASSDIPLLGALLREQWMAYAASWSAAVFDLLLPAALSWRRTRTLAFAAAVIFHLATFRIFSLGLFPWLMIANATLFFPPSWPRRNAPLMPLAAVAQPRITWRHRTGAVALTAHFALQLLVPLRHFLYPGNVLWTEQGMRWSWKVMVAEKAGNARFHVTTATGEWTVYPREYLTPRQEKMMSIQPGMVHQLARRIAADFASRGHREVRVWAEVAVSLNGRRSAPLIDPSVDLSAAELGEYITRSP